MILYVKKEFSRFYTLFYSYPEYVSYVKNSDIEPLFPHDVKMILYHFLEDSGLNPEKLDWSKSIRDLCHSVNSYLRKENVKQRSVKMI